METQPHKYLSSNKPEEIYYEYTPTFGIGQLYCNGHLDPRISNAKESGITINGKIQITNWRILSNLSVPGFQQCLEICYEDLKCIKVDASKGYGVYIVSKGFVVRMNATRPHMVAVDIWTWVCIGLVLELGKDALSIINSYDVASLRVPDDYVSMRSQLISQLHLDQVGLIFPVNSPPSINSKLLVQFDNRGNQGKQIESKNQEDKAVLEAKEQLGNKDADTSDVCSLRLPWLQVGVAYRISSWRVKNKQAVLKGDVVVIIYCEIEGKVVELKAPSAGRIEILKAESQSIRCGDEIARIHVIECSSIATEVHHQSQSSSMSTGTFDAIRQGAIQPIAGSVPRFLPSIAEKPNGFNAAGSYDGDLEEALANAPKYFQSFFNDKVPVDLDGVNDDVISIGSFDEGMYCALVREMHRYTLAQVSDNQEEMAKSNAGLGVMVGSFLALLTGNIFAPFLGHSYAKNMTDRGKRIEEFLPDPNLLFNQDPNSYMAWSRGQVTAPRLRRLIFDRQVSSDEKVYFRLLPAIVTADSVYPIQLFKVDNSTYFYRPMAAGIDREQSNYDAIKIQRKYFHIRAEGEVSQANLSIKVYGRDIEEYKAKVYRFSGQSLDYYYIDFKIQPGCVF